MRQSYSLAPKAKVLPIAKSVTEAKLSTKAGVTRWWKRIIGDPEFLVEWKPPRASIHTDQQREYWRVTLPGKAPVSFSWTRCGLKPAATLALQHLWQEHEKRHPGESMPAALKAHLGMT